MSLSDRKATSILRTEFVESGGQLSPNGRWIAYHSNESGRHEVYVQPFPGPGPKWRISRDGGIWARWRGDGKEIFFVTDFFATDDQLLVAVDVEAGETFAAGDPKPLFPTRRKRTLSREYDVTSDGRRFLVNNTLAGEMVSPITLVLNWNAALKR